MTTPMKEVVVSVITSVEGEEAKRCSDERMTARIFHARCESNPHIYSEDDVKKALIAYEAADAAYQIAFDNFMKKKPG
jgi:hypothetical protein